MSHVREKLEEIQYAVETLFETNPDWVTFYREVMGLQGLVRRAFPTIEQMAAFEQTDTYRLIQRILTELRKLPPTKDIEEQSNVITVRIPQCLHEALRIEAYEYRTSMNKLCISKLLQFIDTENVPTVYGDKKAEADL